MIRERFFKHTLLFPEIYQSQLLSAYVQGKFVERDENVPAFVRAQVISFDPEGGLLENPEGAGVSRSRDATTRDYFEIKSRVGPRNPPRSIRARVLDHDRYVRDDDLRIYWPMFPTGGIDPVMLEYVYVWFEDIESRHGLWVSQVSGPMGESVNFAPGNEPYGSTAQRSGRLADAHGDRRASNTDYGTQENITGAPAGPPLSSLKFD
jgi:hypothetical protein